MQNLAKKCFFLIRTKTLVDCFIPRKICASLTFKPSNSLTTYIVLILGCQHKNLRPAFWCKLKKLFFPKFCCVFFCIFQLLAQKTLIMHILNSVWSAQDPNAGQSITTLLNTSVNKKSLFFVC